MEDTFQPPRRRHPRVGAAVVDGCAVRHIVDDSAIRTKRPSALSSTWSSELVSETVAASSSSSRITATKIVNTVRRSFSVTRRRDSGSMSTGMYSTPEESTPPAPSRFNVRDAYETRPTVQQIAMGLHVSRTPHLRSPRLSPQPYTRSHYGSDSPPHNPSLLSGRSSSAHRRRMSVPTVSLPPPPVRSSLKKPMTPSVARSNSAPTSAPLTPSGSDASLSTLTSTTPSTPRSTRSVSVPFVPARLHLSMSRLLPGRKNSGGSSATARESDDDSASAELTPRKVVRFSTSTREDDP
ncbi:hypothetical protein OBBRIDRAFT_784076 [Obba rivulosa]|uniref:Uncharacterized protein n=1 Tax=Obba rivulosa TaxID=1052685 RepID=A0A8E2DKL7_9APHY|nr:hypothetical protein OBBRIDRAFT_784076 [Obba rivulosa]